MELFHWFVRAHLETVGGELSTGQAAEDEFDAAQAAADNAAVTN
jgi:starvation-inducible DNA-binding protein